MQLYNNRIVKCPLAFQSSLGESLTKSSQNYFFSHFVCFPFSVLLSHALRYFSVEKILKILPTVKDSSNYFKGFFQPSRILPTVKKDSSNHQRFFQPCEKKKFASASSHLNLSNCSVLRTKDKKNKQHSVV